MEWAYGDLSHQHRIVMERIKNDLSPSIFMASSQTLTHEGSLKKVIDGPYFKAYFQQSKVKKGNMGLTENIYYDA